MVMKCKSGGPVRGSSTPARSLHQLLPGRRRAAGGGGWRGEGARAAAAAGWPRRVLGWLMQEAPLRLYFHLYHHKYKIVIFYYYAQRNLIVGSSQN